ncbi:MAG TPA: serine/threonine-protein kinase [Gemmataceae bacterium]|nr:serine/threonine-protein kinase [Gemmataceae bacterium]
MKAHDNNSPKLDDPRVVEALDEYLAALEAGQKPDRHAFLSRHVEIADALGECLDGMEALHEASSASHPPIGGGAAPGDWPPGTPLGDYRILREIGRGGMGVVYEAEQLSLGRRIALKILPFALTLDPRQLQRFKNEARAAAQLHHQHIVPVYTVGIERGVHFYAMQYIEGQSLAEVIHDLRRAKSEGKRPTIGEKALSPHSRDIPPTGPYLPEGELPLADIDTKPIGALATSFSANSNGFYRTVARLGIQAAEALEHAHEYGVIHRDIKPANLMVDGHGHLWITDFGLAQFQSDPGLTRSGDLLGTLRYMSPEQANGQRVAIDHRTDLYSLGATLYELLTQQPPFEGNDRQTLLHQILNDEPRPPRAIQKSIPVELETIVLKSLAKSPAERYATAREMADDLSCFLKDQPIRARRATPMQRLRKWTRRHPSVFWSIVALFFLTVAGSMVSAEIVRKRTEQRAMEAEENFRLAQKALGDMFDLCEQELAGKPFLDSVRQRFLQHLLNYYEQLIDKDRDYPGTQDELARAHDRVLDILDRLAGIQGSMQYHLLKRDDVKQELRISQTQIAELERLEAEARNRHWGERDLSPQERFVRFSEDARRMRDRAKEILTEDQQQRLREIDLQFKGSRAFEDPDIIEKLQLDAAQRENIRTIMAKAFCAAFDGGHSCGMDKPAFQPPHAKTKRDGRPPFAMDNQGGPPPRSKIKQDGLSFHQKGKRDGPSPHGKAKRDGPPPESHPHSPPTVEIRLKKLFLEFKGLFLESAPLASEERRRGRPQNEPEQPWFDPVQSIVDEVLDEEQKQEWRKLTGRPFEFKSNGRGPRGPGGISPPPA